MRFLSAIAVAATAAVTVVQPVAKIRVSPLAAPCAAAAGGRWIWVADYGLPQLLKIDPRTNKVRSVSTIGSGSCGLGYGAGSMWIEDTNSNTVSRVSVSSGKRIAAVPVAATPYDATFAFGSAWTTAHLGGEVDRIDPARNKVVARVKQLGPTGVVAGFGSIWSAGFDDVIRIDPATNKIIATIPGISGAWTAASATAVWITTADGKLVRIDPATNTVAATIALPAVAGDPDVIGGKVWVPIITKNVAVVVDPATNAIVQTVKTGKGPFVITAIRGQAWVPSWKGSDIWRIQP
jgi:hypothetical protein